jgi:hypothetical protein
MNRGAITPEELEALHEDALVMRDAGSLIGIYDARMTLVAASGERSIGAEESARHALALWQGDFTYIADPLTVIQVSDLALIVSRDCISVVRRDRDRCWRYAIVRQFPATTGGTAS